MQLHEPGASRLKGHPVTSLSTSRKLKIRESWMSGLEGAYVVMKNSHPAYGQPDTCGKLDLQQTCRLHRIEPLPCCDRMNAWHWCKQLFRKSPARGVIRSGRDNRGFGATFSACGFSQPQGHVSVKFHYRQDYGRNTQIRPYQKKITQLSRNLSVDIFTHPSDTKIHTWKQLAVTSTVRKPEPFGKPDLSMPGSEGASVIVRN